MTQEEKDLLLKDLSARLPYGVKVRTPYNDAILRGIVDRKGVKTTIDYTDIVTDKQTYPIRYIKPYLRPMSSMTEEEKKELERLIDEKLNGNICQEDDEWVPWVLYDTTGIKNSIGGERFYFDEMSFIYDWLNAHHFDVRQLIEKGLAIDCTGLNVY